MGYYSVWDNNGSLCFIQACDTSLDSTLSLPQYEGATAAPHSPRSPTVAAPVDEKTEKPYSDDPTLDVCAELGDNTEEDAQVRELCSYSDYGWDLVQNV